MTERDPAILRALRLTGLGLWYEAFARAFWPLAALLAVIAAALMLGAGQMLPPRALSWLTVAGAVALLAALIFGLWRLRLPRRDAALRRVDARLPGRPLAALRDQPALGGDGALWQAHRAQMAARARDARPVAPDADLPRRDPFALRLVAATALAMALLFGGAGQLGQGLSAIAATWRPGAAAPDAGPNSPGPSWEGWAEPPRYTNRPRIYLNDVTGDTLTLPKGSQLSFRLYGDAPQPKQSIGEMRSDSPGTVEIIAERSGLITLPDRRFAIEVLPDAPPQVSLGIAATRRADGALIQSFRAGDDHGVIRGEARITLDLAAVDRRHGLTIAPEPRPAETLALPLPGRGDRRDIAGRINSDLSQHPFANLPVRLDLSVRDGLDQEGRSETLAMVLPGRRFFDPLAAALIELRRDLLWSRDNAPRVAQLMRALIWQAEDVAPELREGLRAQIAQLEAGIDAASRDRIADQLWAMAVMLEDGGLSDALAQMRQAQERLSEAIRNGASPDEIQRLMDQLKAATDAYTDMLAAQGEDPNERFVRNQQSQPISGDQIQDMMDEIQRLMNEGRMAEAQELLEQFNRMMENLKITQGGSGGGREGPGSDSMRELADSLQRQRDLSDQAFRQMQDQWAGPGDENAATPEELADDQRALREDLGQSRGLLPGRGSEPGDAARDALDRAGRAMEEAEQALREGDQAGAMERQADAIEALRDGMRALRRLNDPDARRRAEQDGAEGGAAAEGGEAQDGMQGMRSGGRGGLPYAGPADSDPLGRALSGQGGNLATEAPLAEGGDDGARARALLDEIRRRLGDRDRPRDERDYLGRLLERF